MLVVLKIGNATTGRRTSNAYDRITPRYVTVAHSKDNEFGCQPCLTSKQHAEQASQLDKEKDRHITQTTAFSMMAGITTVSRWRQPVHIYPSLTSHQA